MKIINLIFAGLLVAASANAATDASAFGKTLVIESAKAETGGKLEHRSELARVVILPDGTPNRIRSVTEESFPKVESEPDTAGGKGTITLVSYWFGTEVTAKQLPSGAIEVSLEHRQLERTHTESGGTVIPEYSRGGFTTIVSTGEFSGERLVDGLWIRIRVEDAAKSAVGAHASATIEGQSSTISRERAALAQTIQQVGSPHGIDWTPAAPVSTR